MNATTTDAMTARCLLTELGDIDLEHLRSRHVELVAAAAELAHAAGLDWPWSQDDPTVAVLRAISKIALISPDATSHRAGAVCHQLVGPGHRGRTELSDRSVTQTRTASQTGRP